MTFLYISLRLIDSLKMYEMGDKENNLKKLTKVNFNEIKIKTFPKPNISNNKLEINTPSYSILPLCTDRLYKGNNSYKGSTLWRLL